MSRICLNCGATVDENFCPRCGQKAGVKKLTWDSFIEEIFHFFTHIEKGFLKTSKQLILRPGKLCKDYFDGKRKSYHKPVGFLLIWITIYLLVRYLANEITSFETTTRGTLFTFDSSLYEIIRKHRVVIELFISPLMAFIQWIMVARPKLNYVEVLSIYFYLYAFTFMVHITHIIVATCLGVNAWTNLNENISLGIIVGWAFFACYDLFKLYAVPLLIPRLILWIVVNVLVYITVVGIIARILIAWGI